MSDQFRFLFTPLRIGTTTVPNRILQTSHAKMFEDFVRAEGPEGSYALPSERSALYHAERAKGGAGLITMEYHMVHPTSTGGIPYLAHAYRKEIVPRYRMVADMVHGQGTGTKIFGQICHVGMHTAGDQIDVLHEVWAPSAIPGLSRSGIPKVMEKADIREVVQGYARSAENVRDGGLDGVEIHAAHSYLLGQFLSLISNKRSDEYGGSLENRCRLAVEVIEAVRAAVGPDYPLGIRISADEFAPGGLAIQESAEIAKAFAATGKLDWINVSAGAYWSLAPIIVAPMAFPPGFIVNLAAAIKQAVDLPVFCVGRITDPLHAEKVLADNQADMVGMTRALLSDPELPLKAREGRLDDIRHCTGCMYCVGRLYVNQPIACIHNPAAGRESWLGIGTLKPAERPKRVSVVGGGPAGLKAAEIAARRGHSVTLFERSSELGGQVRLAARAPTRADIEEVVRHLIVQCGKLGVELKTGVEVRAGDLLGDAADAVVAATGCRPKRTFFSPLRLQEVAVPGADGPNVLTAWDVLEGAATGDRVVVVDQDGHWRAAGTAEFLADRGKQVTVVTSFPSVGSDLTPFDLMLLIPRFLQKRIRMLSSHEVVAVDGDTVHARHLYTGQEERLEGIDNVVWVTGREANDDLYFALQGKVPELYRVGDCVAPRTIEYAIWEGEMVGRKL
ncbi:MAG: FAD-dependent oxidoreductase [Chloroflexi bacterium]|nr:FAD-dependent oxidoreductase [Chloroflexota bacterium]